MNRRNLVLFIAAGLAVAFVLAFFVSPYASSKPDGLNKVAADKGFDSDIQESPVNGSPLAGYDVHGVHDAKLSKGLSGIIGVALTFAIGYGLLTLLRASRRRTHHRFVASGTREPSGDETLDGAAT
ncbi:MAG TPA: PDGLE domain-containing protein [Acidimicrobiales bacterium]|nr:PDGLE domain-containing protein [Acidimicrobiales bacterium]